MATLVLGVQWGDEGKGKLCDILAADADICARGTGGHNCGHTVVVNGQSYDFHMLPSGLLNPKATNLIGPGVVLHIPTFFSELETCENKGIHNARERLRVSSRCALNLNLHGVADRMREESLGAKKIGTTGRGIGPAYSSKAERSSIIVAELLDEDGSFEDKIRALAEGYKSRFGMELLDYKVEDEIAALKEAREKLRPFVIDDVEFLHQAQAQGKKIMIEGAQSAMLDLTYGTFPYVTSSATTLGGVLAGLTISPRKIDSVVGVMKAYVTRVGSGPFPTEDFGEAGTTLQERGHEWGVSTGRRRRCGWLDLPVAKYSHAVNHYDVLNVTKLDVCKLCRTKKKRKHQLTKIQVLDSFTEIKVGVAYKDPKTGRQLDTFPSSARLLENVEVVYETLKGWNQDITKVKSYSELPQEAKDYLEFIEKNVGVPVRYIGCGPSRENIIIKGE